MKRKLTKPFVLSFIVLVLLSGCGAQKTKTKESALMRIYVPEEGGINFEKITDETMETLTKPNVYRMGMRLQWWENPLFCVSKDGKTLAYNVYKNEKKNIFIKSLDVRGASTQRTTRSNVQDVCISPNNKDLCFSEDVAGSSRLYLTSATQGTMVTQVSPVNVSDYGPCYSLDGSRIFFSRADNGNYSIWSYDVERGSFSNYCYGMNPSTFSDEEFLCTRKNSTNNYEIWLINYVKGSESILLSQENHSFTSASVSPNGKWVVCVGNTKPNGSYSGENLDIYVVRTDGSHLTQLTYHPGHDCSPVWAPDGKSIYFLSQRGSKKGEYNIWKMNFTL